MEAQLKINRNWAKEHGYIVEEVFTDEAKSGTNTNRKALDDMLSKCVTGNVDAILVIDTDRLSRNETDHFAIKAILKKANVKLISVNQPMLDDSPEGMFMDTIIAGVNAFQSRMTGRKTSKVMEQKALIGWYPGGRPPLGYHNVQNPNPCSTLDKKIIDLNPLTAPYMKRAFELYSTGRYSAQILANQLYKEGLRSVTGTIIHDSVLISYLQHPFYLGKMRWSGKILQGKHPPLISEEIFNLCQEVLVAHNQNGSRTKKHNFLLRGFVFCYDCKARLWAEKKVKQNGLIYEYYYCRTCPKGTYVTIQALEEQVARHFKNLEITEDYANQIIEKAKNILLEARATKKSEKGLLYHRKSKLEIAMREAEDKLLIHKTLSDESFKRVNDRYEAEMKDIDSQLNEEDDSYKDKIDVIKKVYELARNIGKTYNEAEPQLKRFYLALFWERFEVQKGKIKSSKIAKDLEPLISDQLVRVRQNGLPLVNMFRNREIQFEVSHIQLKALVDYIPIMNATSA
ncbi:MAG: recombinase family protein [bacterium]|nr:recombinase family protein [bacterium]